MKRIILWTLILMLSLTFCAGSLSSTASAESNIPDMLGKVLRSFATPEPTGESAPEATAEPAAETPAPAAPAVTAAPEADAASDNADAPVFVFRSGVTWGMAPADVEAVEGRAADAHEALDLFCSVAFFDNTAVSRYTAILEYFYWEDTLQTAVYEFSSSYTEKDFTYLASAMSNVYGEVQTIDAQQIVDMMDQLVPGMYTADDLFECMMWTAEEGTCIYMFYYNETDFVIMYVNTEFFSSGAAYNTLGL